MAKKRKSFLLKRDYLGPSEFGLDMDHLTEETAIEYFIRVRWADNDGKPYCPKCGHDHVYRRKTRIGFVCANPDCRHNFSPTSGTAFDNRKMSYKKYVSALHAFANNAKGVSVIQLRGVVRCTYRNAYILEHKLRELIVQDNSENCSTKPRLNGDMTVDGKWVGGHQKRTNKIENQKDRRRSENQSGKRRCIVSIKTKGERTRVAVFQTEAAGVEWVKSNIGEATVHLDEAYHWDQIGLTAITKRVNHKEMFSDEGVSINSVESLNSRYKRSEIGVYHHISGHTLFYATELAWREDSSKQPILEKVDFLTKKALSSRRCRSWRADRGRYLAVTERRKEIDNLEKIRQVASSQT